VRPILDVWKEEILDCLKKRKIPYRTDQSNADTRFERNWVRNVLIPLLVKRYGKSVKKRIFTLGERFRELDDYIEAEAGKWIRRNVNMSPEKNAAVVFRRKTFSALPTVLRVKILQRICFDRLGVAPNERLLKAMDGNVRGGGPSARVNAGKGGNCPTGTNRRSSLREKPEAGGNPRDRFRRSCFALPGRLSFLPVRRVGASVSFGKPGGSARRRRRSASRGRGTPRCSTRPA